MRVRWLKEARIEAADSARFYGEKDANLGAALVAEVQDRIDHAVPFPEAGVRVPGSRHHRLADTSILELSSSIG